jgi:hypothetical protein
MSQKDRFNTLIADAMVQDFKGWDFSYLNAGKMSKPIALNYGQFINTSRKMVFYLLAFTIFG